MIHHRDVRSFLESSQFPIVPVIRLPLSCLVEISVRLYCSTAFFILFPSLLLVVLWYFFTWVRRSSSCILMLLVGRQFGGSLLADLSSNGSIRTRCESVSTVFFVRHSASNVKVLPFGTTTAFGPYDNSLCEFHPLRLRGRQGYKHTCACVLHFDFGVEQACSAAARVTFSLAPLGHPLRPPPADRFFSPTRRFLMPRARLLRIHAFCGSALPSSGPTSSFLRSSMRVQFLFGGGRTCFPDRVLGYLPGSHWIFLRFCTLVLRSLSQPARPDVFSRPRLRTGT